MLSKDFLIVVFNLTLVDGGVGIYDLSSIIPRREEINIMELITDINQRLLGYTRTDPHTGRQDLYDRHMGWLGWYDMRNNYSFDRNMHCLGRGNQVMRLLPK